MDLDVGGLIQHRKTFRNWHIIFSQQQFVLGRLEAFARSYCCCIVAYDRSPRAFYDRLRWHVRNRQLSFTASASWCMRTHFSWSALVECLITLGQFDLRCSTALLPVGPIRVCVSFYLRFFSRCFCCCMSDMRTFFQTSYKIH